MSEELSGSGAPTTQALIDRIERFLAVKITTHTPSETSEFVEAVGMLHAAADALRSLPAALEDSRILRQGCIVEIACCNDSKSVLDYMNHWEPRALAAEATLRGLPPTLAAGMIERLKARAEAAEAEVARLQVERDRWFVECERLATGLMETFEERVDEDHDGDLRPEDAVDVAFRLCDDLLKSEAEVARLTQARDTLQHERDEAVVTIATLVQLAHDYGWNGVENSKFLAVFLAEKLRAGAEAGPLPAPERRSQPFVSATHGHAVDGGVLPIPAAPLPAWQPIEAERNLAMQALADIAFSDDMTLSIAKAKAKRIYKKLNGPLPSPQEDR